MATGNELIRRDSAAPDNVERGLAKADAMGGEVVRSAESSTQQLEAQARALVQARFFIAKQPHMQRSWDQVEQKLRKECLRPGFARSAWWVLPYAQGLTIRFAEAALRLCGNIDVQQQTVFDDDWKRIVRVTVMDLETNFAYTSEITIDKTVERSDTKGREVLSVRQNSAGRLTYLVSATEEELAKKQGSFVSKAIRTLGLRLIPGDILDECKAIILDTRKKGSEAEDPEAARKTILDSFASIGVMPTDLAKYIGHDTDVFQPAERDELRGLYTAIRDGNATWRDALEAKVGSAEEKTPGAKKVEELLKKKADAKKPAPQANGSNAATQAAEAANVAAKSGKNPEIAGNTASDAAGAAKTQETKPASIPTFNGEWPDGFDGPECIWNGVHYRFSDDSGNYVPVKNEPEPSKQQAQQTAAAKRGNGRMF